MSGPSAGASFSADWLRQREPFDAQAREDALRAWAARPADLRAWAARLADLRAWATPAQTARGAGALAGLLRRSTPDTAAPDTPVPLRVLDLACGTGANLRWLAPRLGGAQQWLVVDHDADLLARWPACLGLPGPIAGDAPLHWAEGGVVVDVQRRVLDLAQALAGLPWPSVQLVTASALLDLVSTGWLQQLVAALVSAQAACLMALNVDGRHRWSSADPLDSDVGRWFAAHQQRDKGFGGPALGAAAGPALASALRRAGYRVQVARSDWRLEGRHDPAARALQSALIDGMAAAAAEQQPAAGEAIDGWRQRRQALAARSTLVVGHVDVLAWPRP